uniref:Uncharacterized protein n=1 Tax=Romanomermis culicivorax TaxID=13658 RepID=A0A915IPM6_ROMCU
MGLYPLLLRPAPQRSTGKIQQTRISSSFSASLSQFVKSPIPQIGIKFKLVFFVFGAVQFSKVSRGRSSPNT